VSILDLGAVAAALVLVAIGVVAGFYLSWWGLGLVITLWAVAAKAVADWTGFPKEEHLQSIYFGYLVYPLILAVTGCFAAQMIARRRRRERTRRDGSVGKPSEANNPYWRRD